MHTMQIQPLLTSDVIEHAAKFHGDREVVSLIDKEKPVRLTWRDIAKRARCLANALRQRKIVAGDRVATLAWNDHRHLEAWYAVSGIGAIIHTVNPRLFPDQIEYIIKHAEAKLVFVDATLVPLLCSLNLDFSKIGVVVFPDPSVPDVDAPFGYLCFEEFIEACCEIENWPRFEETTPSSLCYTSGTTGLPKGVLYTHRSTLLHSFATALPDVMNLSARDTIYPVVPMFHANAWGLPYTAALVGAKLIFSGRHLDAGTVSRFAQQEGATFSAGVPTVWKALLDHLDSGAPRPEKLERLLVGGSAMPRAMIDAFYVRHGIKVTHAWGMTETSPLGTVSDPLQSNLDWRDELEIRVKQGRPPFGVDLRLVGDDGTILPHDGKTPGALQVKGHWIVKRYFKAQTPILTNDGWFDTGDIATIDETGFMQITDRAKDIIKSGGEWISSVDLETQAVAFGGVRAAAVVGAPHPKWGERPVLILVPEVGSGLATADVLRYLETCVPKWWIPDYVAFQEELPLTATGKVNKLALREKYSEVYLGAIS